MVPDYYARLGVDPGATAAEIEAALLKQQPIWSMGTRNPKTRHTNQLYLDEIPGLRRALLGVAEARAAYDAELVAAHVAERERKLDELQRRVRLRAAKGGLTGTDRSLLRDEAARLGLDQELLDRLTRLIPVLVESVDTPAGDERDVEPPTDVLDPSTRRQIRGALEHLDRRDLYDALGLFRDAPTSVIAARADEERQRWMKKAQVTAEKTAWLEVISHAQSHLTSAKPRARYDRTLALEAEEKFEAMTAFTLQGLTRLDAGTHAVLVDEAAVLGIGSDRANLLIGRSCRKAGVLREPGPTAPAGSLAAGGVAPASAGASSPSSNGAYQQLRCRNCSGVTELSPVMRRTGPARCRHCGASLKWDCPVCRRSHWVDEPRCACGFLLSLREPLIRHFAAAQHAFRVHDMASARAHLEWVQKFAPHHVGARNGMAKIHQHAVDVETSRAAYELAVAGKKLVEARRAVEAWRKLVDPASPEVQSAWKAVAARLRQAEALAARARRLERRDPPTARELYRRSLEIAADLPDAQAGLYRCPPDAPTGLGIHPLGDRVRLTWTPPAPDGLGPLTYAIMRKHGEIPAHPGDGARIAEVSTCEFEDRRVRPGEAVSYAVLAKRGEAESLTAVAAGPVAFLPDVQDVRIEPREGVVELSWIPPHGVFEVRVVRKRGAPPSGPRDGDRVGASLDQSLDTELQDDQVYHYGIYAIYRQSDGRRFPSPGVVVAAIPRSPILPPNPPRLLLTPDGRVRLDWIEPARGSVRILRTPRPLPYAPGTVITLAQAEQLGGHWITILGPDRAEDSAPPGNGLCHYTPLLAMGGNLTVGHGAVLSRVADPSDLRVTRVGSAGSEGAGVSRLQFRWRWSPGVDSTRIVIRQGNPPSGPDDPEAIVVNVGREEYDRAGAWTISLAQAEHGEPSDFELEPTLMGPGTAPSTNRWHATAYSAVETENGLLLSPGLDPTATIEIPGPHPEVTLSYSLKRPWLPGRPWSLVVHTEPSGESVPPIVLVANPRAVPLSADDGDVIGRWPASKDGAVLAIRSGVNLGRSGVRAFPDPTADPDSLPPIRIRHPESGMARV